MQRENPDPERESPGLVRYWFEFDVADQKPPDDSLVRLDGGTLAFRYFGSGAGVTGYDEADCLLQLTQMLDAEPLPPVIRRIRQVDVSSLPIDPRFIGVPVWRGVWFPYLNRSGPTRS